LRASDPEPHNDVAERVVPRRLRLAGCLLQPRDVDLLHLGERELRTTIESDVIVE